MKCVPETEIMLTFLGKNREITQRCTDRKKWTVLLCVFNLYHMIELESTISRLPQFNTAVISY